MSSSDTPSEGPDPRSRLRAERRSIEFVRAREFLIAQSTILGIALVLVLGSNLSGLMAPVVVVQSIVFCGFTAILTIIGWAAFLRQKAASPLVVALLYVDSIVGIVFFYVAGEFETPALGIAFLCVVMAPVFAGRGHAWGIAISQWLLYSFLILSRAAGWGADTLPYGYLLPKEAIDATSFLLDSWVSYSIAVFGLAYLAGRASIDIVNSQAQLEDEVAKNTEALSRTSADLQAANDALERANTRLAATNAALESTNVALADANDDLRAANARLEQFNSAVSHDLRAPLQALIMRAEMLSASVESGRGDEAELAEAIADGAVRMGNLIEELLKLSRLKDSVEGIVSVSCFESVELVRQSLAGRLASTGGRVEVVGSLPVVRANPTLLHEVFQNLVDNGLKYGAPGGPVVRIQAFAAPPGRGAVAVDDNGAGIPLDDRATVFGLFKRLPQHRSIEGTGAGLAIVRRIVEVHGGSIRIEEGGSLPGARFVVELPAPT